MISKKAMAALTAAAFIASLLAMQHGKEEHIPPVSPHQDEEQGVLVWTHADYSNATTDDEYVLVMKGNKHFLLDNSIKEKGIPLESGMILKVKGKLQDTDKSDDRLTGKKDKKFDKDLEVQVIANRGNPPVVGIKKIITIGLMGYNDAVFDVNQFNYWINTQSGPFYNASSYGVAGLSGTLYSKTPFISQYSHSDLCGNAGKINSEIKRLADPIIDFSSYNYISVGMPSLCFANGYASSIYVDGRWVPINVSRGVFSMSHEIGHDMGLGHHSSYANCSNFSPTIVWLGCTHDEYGGPTVMGLVDGVQSPAMQKDYLAWMKHQDGTSRVQALSLPGAYNVTLYPLDSNVPDKIQAIKIARSPAQNIWLEIRTGESAVKLNVDYSNMASPHIFKGMIADGEVAIDPITHTEIAILSVNAGVATVSVKILPDGDGDYVPDAYDVCPAEKETFNASNDIDGCPDGFTIKALPTVLTVAAGSKISGTVQMTSYGGFSKALTVKLGSCAPIGVTCTVSPASVSLPANGSVNSTFTFAIPSTAAKQDYFNYIYALTCETNPCTTQVVGFTIRVIPFVDTDGDGVADDMDFCPILAGPSYNQGCPVPENTQFLRDEFNDGTLQGWTKFGGAGYSLTNEAGRAKISGDGYPVTAGMEKTIFIIGWNSTKPLILDFDWQAKSGYAGSRVTNAYLSIDGTVYTLQAGGVLNTGLQHKTLDISSIAAGKTSLKIKLYLDDIWSTNWSQVNYYDNIYLNAN